ncbi:MAG: DUF805 domain-containing protein [Proteobacteria bacterium]|nr:DUF805 domain-containing protein [Pseudomonadota bacterium]
MPYRRYFAFHGRASRLEFWSYHIFLILVALSFIIMLAGSGWHDASNRYGDDAAWEGHSSQSYDSDGDSDDDKRESHRGSRRNFASDSNVTAGGGEFFRGEFYRDESGEFRGEFHGRFDGKSFRKFYKGHRGRHWRDYDDDHDGDYHRYDHHHFKPSGLTITLGVGFILFGLFSFIPHLAVTVRRLHDADFSGFWWFIQFVPVIGWVWLLILLVMPPAVRVLAPGLSDADMKRGTNRFGESLHKK